MVVVTHFYVKSFYENTERTVEKTHRPVAPLPPGEEPPLTVGDRVVWMSDTGPEHGLVRWIGHLPDVGPDWTVGVQFVSHNCVEWV